MKSLSAAIVVFAGIYGITNVRQIGIGHYALIFLVVFTVMAVIGLVRFLQSTEISKPASQQLLPYVVPGPHYPPSLPENRRPSVPAKTDSPPPSSPQTP